MYNEISESNRRSKDIRLNVTDRRDVGVVDLLMAYIVLISIVKIQDIRNIFYSFYLFKLDGLDLNGY